MMGVDQRLTFGDPGIRESDGVASQVILVPGVVSSCMSACLPCGQLGESEERLERTSCEDQVQSEPYIAAKGCTVHSPKIRFSGFIRRYLRWETRTRKEPFKTGDSSSMIATLRTQQ